MRWVDAITDSPDVDVRRVQDTGEGRGAWRAAVQGATGWDRFGEWTAAAMQPGVLVGYLAHSVGLRNLLSEQNSFCRRLTTHESTLFNFLTSSAYRKTVPTRF